MARRITRWYHTRRAEHAPPWRMPDMGMLEHAGFDWKDRHRIWGLVSQAWADGYNDAVDAHVAELNATLLKEKGD